MFIKMVLLDNYSPDRRFAFIVKQFDNALNLIF